MPVSRAYRTHGLASGLMLISPMKKGSIQMLLHAPMRKRSLYRSQPKSSSYLMPENGLWTNPYYCQNSYVECEEHVAGDGEDVRFKDRVAQVTKSQGEVVCRRLERYPRE
jgi:hypothetical protein